MRRAVFLAAVVLGAGGAACASILGIEDGVLGDAGAEAGVPVCTVDSGVRVNPDQVFVSAGFGSDDESNAGCSSSQPCKTIARGLAAAKKYGASILYVGDGTYDETIHLVAGVEIQSGWSPRPDNRTLVWKQVCNPGDDAKIVGLEGTTVHADDLGGEAKVTNIRLTSHPPSGGESLYGILATGATTKVTLQDVVVEIGNAGDGDAGVVGTDGVPLTGGCTPSDPGTPEAGAPGTGSPAETFGQNGIVVMAGSSGNPGGNGGSGPPGSDGTCVSCYICAGSLTACAKTADSCGGGGKEGCGGQGGGGGTAGVSGGSAIGVYAWGGATVIGNGGQVHVGNGGRGGPGGVGGNGGDGGVGSDGDPGASCNTACNTVVGACSSMVKSTGAGVGGNGTQGAVGARGGQGGGGAGGFAYGSVSGADASVVLTGVGVTVGAGGLGGDVGGASGTQGDHFP